jgi:hypothetical protein
LHFVVELPFLGPKQVRNAAMFDKSGPACYGKARKKLFFAQKA